MTQEELPRSGGRLESAARATCAPLSPALTGFDSHLIERVATLVTQRLERQSFVEQAREGPPEAGASPRRRGRAEPRRG